MGKDKIKLKFLLTVASIVFCLGFFVDSAEAADIEASASRTTGVAPLSVHFNADLTASSEIERSFHDLEYSWNFGDTNAGNWGTTGKPKNEDKGPVAAHVYETSGNFTTMLIIRDATGVIDIKTFEITVEDPNIVFAGTKTTCISTDADFIGCPAGANQITINDLANISQYADAGERILFRRGDAWTVSSQIPFPNNQGPVSIGAFGACNDPDELGICENAPLVTIDTTLGQSGHSFLNQTNKSDWRLADISFAATMGNGYVTSGTTNVKNHLAYKIKADGFFTPFYTTHWRHNDTDYFDNNAYVSSRLTGSSLWLIYTGSERLSVMGNVVKNSDQSHVVRLWQSYQAVVSHNNISGAGLNYPGSGRQALKLFGPTTSNDPTVSDRVGTFAETGNAGLRNRTEFVVIANNLVGGSGPWPIGIGPQNGERDERMSDLLVEKNKMIADYGEQHYQVNTGIQVSGRYATIRNNIVDGTGGRADFFGISVFRRGVEWTPLGNRVYNNTVYSQNNHTSEAIGVFVHADANDTIVRNNYVSLPNTTSPTLLTDNSGNAISSNNVLTNAPYFIDSDNANPLLRNFSLTSLATEAIDQGITVPVFDDFTGQSRSDVYDIGAYEYTENTSFRADVDGSSSITTTDALLTLRNSLGLSMNGTAWRASAITGDVNCDGVSNSTDALLILRYSLGLSMSATTWCG